MNKFVLILISIFLSVPAFALNLKPVMRLNLVCGPKQGELFKENTVTIVADRKGTTITARGKTYTGPVMHGKTTFKGGFGSEYGQAYIDVQIYLMGGDLDKLTWDNPVIEEGTTSVSGTVFEGRNEDDFSLRCRGLIGIYP